ncbi:MAG: family 78 glycoside hydrolase catalytic domain [Clostridia bacterium]
MLKNLRCEYMENPLGMDNPCPVFSWVLETGEMEIQRNHQIVVEDMWGVCWDSGNLEGNRSTGIVYGGEPLKSNTFYTWTVRVTTDKKVHESSSNHFITGYMDPGDVRGQWITHPGGSENPVFFREIAIHGEIRHAFVIISGLGYYHLEINHVKGHDTVLVPGWTDYSQRSFSRLAYPYQDNSAKRVLYNCYRIESLLKQGSNLVSVELGNGWFNQYRRAAEGDMVYGKPVLFMEVHVCYADGSKEVIVSDESFYCTEGGLKENNIFYGETRDDRSEPDYSCTVKAVPYGGTLGALEGQAGCFDRVVHTSSPVELHDGIHDAGKNMTGWVSVLARGKRGDSMRITYFDALTQDGSPDFGPAGGDLQIQRDEYVFGDREEVCYSPRFTWHGFRYFTLDADTGIEILGLDVEQVNCDIARTGFIKTGHGVADWLFQAFNNSYLSNLHGGVPSDCPHRERLGYTGDGQVVCDTGLWSTDSIPLYMKWMRDIILSQNRDTGYIPHTVPFYGGGGGYGWGSAVAVVPWTLYKHTRDIRVLASSHEAIRKWIDYMDNHSDSHILTKEEEGSWCLGDWCIPVGGYDVQEVDLERISKALDPRLVNTCFFYHCTDIYCRMTDILGIPNKHYRALGRKILKAFHKVFFDEGQGHYGGGWHGSDILPLYLGMTPEGCRMKAGRQLARNIHRNGFRMDTGIFGTAWLFDVLSDIGLDDMIIGILDNREYPSFGYMMEKGATTLWETWDGKASLNHPMFGAACGFFFNKLLGLEVLGDNRLVFRPVFLKGLDCFHAGCEVIYGRVEMHWRREKDGIHARITIPSNTEGLLVHRNMNVTLKNLTNEVHIQ